MQLKLINNITKNTIIIDEIQDNFVSALFYTFDISLPDGVNDGEYTYELYNEIEMVAIGLLQIGDYQDTNKEYNESKKGYIVYDGE